MSWSDWVSGPNGLITEVSEIHRAAIYGQDGTCWAEEKLQCTKEEIMFISNMFITGRFSFDNFGTKSRNIEIFEI